jgi:Caulimovirus viroplasmin
MSRKQSTPRQLHLLREVKRKAVADQEERLQQALARLVQQGSSSSKAGTQHHLRISPDPSIDKYYAVRRGRVNNSIYTSWLECKAQVHQYPGAEYKSFTKYDQATAYLQAKGNRIQPAPLIPDTPLESGRDKDVVSTRTTGTQTADPEIEVNPGYRKFKIASLGFILGVITTLWILLLLSPTRMR